LLLDVFLDALLDTLKTLPFLIAVYFLLEYLEHKAEAKTILFVRKSGKYAPAVGSLLGLLPQCGFSAASANLYSAGVISRGALIAVFLSTSDEMLPILIAGDVPVGKIIRILFCKFIAGMIAGFSLDLIEGKRHLPKKKKISTLCAKEHCRDEESIVKAAFIHSFKIAGFLFIVNFLLNLAVEGFGLENLDSFIFNRPVLGELLAALIGLIPNCASSVVITHLYLQGAMSAGAMLSGLLTGAGVGLLVLFRTNRNVKENLITLVLLYAFGVILGFLGGICNIL